MAHESEHTKCELLGTKAPPIIITTIHSHNCLCELFKCVIFLCICEAQTLCVCADSD